METKPKGISGTYKGIKWWRARMCDMTVLSLKEWRYFIDDGGSHFRTQKEMCKHIDEDHGRYLANQEIARNDMKYREQDDE